jgi:hypothetical protein
MNGQRANALDSAFINDFARLSSRQRRIMARVRHARELERGTAFDYTVSNEDTMSSWDATHFIRKYENSDKTPKSDKLSVTICRRNIFNTLLSDVAFRDYYKGDKTALNLTCSKRRKN